MLVADETLDSAAVIISRWPLSAQQAPTRLHCSPLSSAGGHCRRNRPLQAPTRLHCSSQVSLAKHRSSADGGDGNDRRTAACRQSAGQWSATQCHQSRVSDRQDLLSLRPSPRPLCTLIGERHRSPPHRPPASGGVKAGHSRCHSRR